ncbi:MAG: Type 1 glutamine amidotransferase-like domain-containing protein [Bacilli bacterium]|nr:Type 1 glutamine amidotransferase-like domain-containing protein [Bacilli bacterium]
MENVFFHELAQKLKSDLNSTNRIVYIPGSTKPEKIEKAKKVYVPLFTEHFKRIGIEFKNIDLITPDMDKKLAQQLVINSDMVMLMGGNPFLQKDLIESKHLSKLLQNYNSVIMGFSAGAMNMSKYIIITPCSEEYPKFDIRPGLNLSNISIYPHNNFEGDIFPDKVDMGGEITISSDLLKVAKEYGNFYCLQDHTLSNGLTNVSLIRTSDNNIEIITDNNGKVWEVTELGFNLVDTILKDKKQKK